MLKPTPTTPNFNCNNPPFLIKIKRRAKNRNKSAIFFFPAIIELVRELVISNMHTNLKRIREKLFKLSRPQGQIIDVKGEKSQ